MLLFLLIAFLFPVAVYCSVLAAINRRSQPLLVSGTWDFVGLLFASAGFLLITGPTMALMLYKQGERSFWASTDTAVVSREVVDVLASGFVYWGLYYGLVVGGAVALLWWRRKNTVVYNVQPEVFDSVFEQVLKQNQVPWRRHGKRLMLFSNGTSAPVSVSDAHRLDAAMHENSSYVSIDAVPLLCNISLHWQGPTAERLREQLEVDLDKSLRQVYTEENPAAGWLLGISAVMFLIMIFTTSLVILIALMRR